MNIRSILQSVQSLSPERAEELAIRFEGGLLSHADRQELEQHVLSSLETSSQDGEIAAALLASLPSLH